MAEEKKKSGFGKGCLTLVAIFFGLILLGAIMGGDGDNTTSRDANGSNRSGAQPGANFPTPVTAIQLEKAYADNEAAAQQQYGERQLLVSGTISKIQLDFSDEPYIVFVGENAFTGTQAHLSKQAQGMAASLSKDQQIRLLCEGLNEVGGTAMLRDCRLPDTPAQ